MPHIYLYHQTVIGYALLNHFQRLFLAAVAHYYSRGCYHIIAHAAVLSQHGADAYLVVFVIDLYLGIAALGNEMTLQPASPVDYGVPNSGAGANLHPIGYHAIVNHCEGHDADIVPHAGGRQDAYARPYFAVLPDNGRPHDVGVRPDSRAFAYRHLSFSIHIPLDEAACSSLGLGPSHVVKLHDV